jgi:hypothetical protein
MRKSHPIRRVVLAGAATVSGIVLLLSLKPASDPAAAVTPTASGGPSAADGASAAANPSAGASAPGSAPGASKPGASAQDATPTASTQRVAPPPPVPAWSPAAQSADIDTVSGASYTSKGYRTSLQSALDQADG